MGGAISRENARSREREVRSVSSASQKKALGPRNLNIEEPVPEVLPVARSMRLGEAEVEKSKFSLSGNKTVDKAP